MVCIDNQSESSRSAEASSFLMSPEMKEKLIELSIENAKELIRSLAMPQVKRPERKMKNMYAIIICKKGIIKFVNDETLELFRATQVFLHFP
jgi:hypothetical protein